MGLRQTLESTRYVTEVQCNGHTRLARTAGSEVLAHSRTLTNAPKFYRIVRYCYIRLGNVIFALKY